MELKEPFKTQAANELREDDTRRDQALVQFREWISKQDHIKNPRTDDNYLLRFLRVKKYANADSFKMYEKLLIVKEANPEWFQNLNLEDERMRELFESEYCFPLIERDRDGCPVLFFQSGKLDLKKYNEHDIYKILMWLVMNLLEDPNTQVSGFKFVSDYQDSKIEVIGVLSLSNLKKYFSCLQNAVPSRQKHILWINYPAVAVKIFEISKTFMSKKLADRSAFCSDDAKLYEHFDVKILPKEYGGEKSSREMIECFKVIANANKESIKKFEEQSIDLTRVVDFEVDPVGSFKKLDID